MTILSFLFPDLFLKNHSGHIHSLAIDKKEIWLLNKELTLLSMGKLSDFFFSPKWENEVFLEGENSQYIFLYLKRGKNNYFVYYKPRK